MNMLRAVLLPVLFLALASSLPATTPAVDSPGSLPILLGLDSVRKELKVGSLQRAVLDSLRSEYKSEVRKLTNPMPATPAQRLAAESRLASLNERYNARAMSVLNDSQRARLREIEHQVLGGTKLISPSVQKKLGLTTKQKLSIEALRRKGLDDVGKVNRQFEEGRISYQERIDLLRDRRLSQAEAFLKVLTPEQRNAFLLLGGAKFTI
ncbi:MAG TPA: hypothetical protein PLS03_12440 [Terrimicrobiaceae bacterium]|nr:hypothetical protein [Terrimicrobiaceae bacterium]